MGTMNVSLPAVPKRFVDAQVGSGVYALTSEHVGDPITRP